MKFYNQRGFTLVETLVAAMIATIIAYSSFSVFPFLRKTATGARASAGCQNYLSANFARIESMGTSPRVLDPNVPTYYAATTVPMLPTHNDVTGSMMTPMYSQVLINSASSADIPDVRTAGLYMSSVTLVNGLYANHASICSSGITFNAGSLSPSTLLTPPPPDISKDFAVSMQIQPVNLTSRMVAACGTAGYDQTMSTQIAPKGLALSKTVAENQNIATMNARNDVGFAVTLKASYTNPASLQTQTCTETRQIAYTADLVPPAAPVVKIEYDHTFSATAWSPPSAKVDFTYIGEEGVVLICRDNSTFVHEAEVVPPKNPGVHLTSDPVTASGVWVPCDQVSVCGRRPLGVTTASGSSGSFNLTTRWNANEIPYGCQAKIDAVAIDPSGNVSATTSAYTNISDDGAGGGATPAPTPTPIPIGCKKVGYSCRGGATITFCCGQELSNGDPDPSPSFCQTKYYNGSPALFCPGIHGPSPCYVDTPVDVSTSDPDAGSCP